MNVLVFNCGSSSLKYTLIGMPGEERLVHGEAERVGAGTTGQPVLTVCGPDGERTVDVGAVTTRFEGVENVLCEPYRDVRVHVLEVTVGGTIDTALGLVEPKRRPKVGEQVPDFGDDVEDGSVTGDGLDGRRHRRSFPLERKPDVPFERG